MPTRAYNSSLRVVAVQSKTYQVSVDPVIDKTFTGSMYAAMQPDRRFTGSVQTVPPDGPLRGFNGSLVAYFSPTTPERQLAASILVLPQATRAVEMSGSVVTQVLSTFTQVSQSSVFVATQVQRQFIAAVVARVLDLEKVYSTSLRVMPYFSKDFRASAVLRATLVRTFLASVRPYHGLTGGEQATYDAAVNYLIPEVIERDSITAQIAILNARLAVLNTDIAAVLAILLDLDDKPSVLLNSLSASSGLRRTGGETLTLFGTNFIPTCQVRIKQGASDFGLFNTVEQSPNHLNVTTPDFTGLGGIVLTDPLTIRVENPNTEVSEYLTFTLGLT